MKKQIKIALALALCLICVLSLIACNAGEGNVEQPAGDGSSDVQTKPGEATPTGVWESATHLTDKEFGEGAKTIQVEVIAEGQSVTFTVHTDKEMLGEALLEHGLIDGDQGAYGLYVKVVNGMMADYNVNQRYWSFSKNGEGLMTGVDMETAQDGAHYEITYTK